MSTPSLPKNIVYAVLGIALVFGCVTGYLLASQTATQDAREGTRTDGSVETVSNEQKAGIIDKNTFTDTTTGILREGGFEGEGSHQLERGAKDQTAYLTSSTVDLDEYIGKKVRVWGKTYSGDKTGWLMDVGLIELVQ